MNKPFDFKILKRDTTMKYLHDRMREIGHITSGERFYVTCEVNPNQSVLFRSRSNKQIQSARNYLSSVWGEVVTHA